MSLKFVNLHGEEISEGRMQAAAALQTKRKAVIERPAEFHKGFKVVGHPPPQHWSRREPLPSSDGRTGRR